jgi:hypothetical protein
VLVRVGVSRADERGFVAAEFPQVGGMIEVVPEPANSACWAARRETARGLHAVSSSRQSPLELLGQVLVGGRDGRPAQNPYE